jgi:MazG family protein
MGEIKNLEKKHQALTKIMQIMEDLREKCPWDRKQTIESLRNLTIEETFELADAISTGNKKDIEEELGDVLLHIIFYAKLGEEQGDFDLISVIDKLSEKLIHRHPHIYGGLKVNDEEEVKKNWEALKLKEGKKGVLSGVPKSLPAMIKAYRIQEKAGQVGFEWDNKEAVWEKVEEEILEFRNAEITKDQDSMEEEFGDILFSLINYARYCKIDPESALEKINSKFKSRFEFIETHARKPLTEMSLEDMDKLWNEAKERAKIHGKEEK